MLACISTVGNAKTEIKIKTFQKMIAKVVAFNHAEPLNWLVAHNKFNSTKHNIARLISLFFLTLFKVRHLCKSKIDKCCIDVRCRKSNKTISFSLNKTRFDHQLYRKVAMRFAVCTRISNSRYAFVPRTKQLTVYLP